LGHKQKGGSCQEPETKIEEKQSSRSVEYTPVGGDLVEILQGCGKKVEVSGTRKALNTCRTKGTLPLSTVKNQTQVSNARSSGGGGEKTGRPTLNCQVIQKRIEQQQKTGKGGYKQRSEE